MNHRRGAEERSIKKAGSRQKSGSSSRGHNDERRKVDLRASRWWGFRLGCKLLLRDVF
jgi:hypothetical protein